MNAIDRAHEHRTDPEPEGLNDVLAALEAFGRNAGLAGDAAERYAVEQLAVIRDPVGYQSRSQGRTDPPPEPIRPGRYRERGNTVQLFYLRGTWTDLVDGTEYVVFRVNHPRFGRTEHWEMADFRERFTRLPDAPHGEDTG